MTNENSEDFERSVFNVINYPKFQYPMIGVIVATFLSTLMLSGGFVYLLIRILREVSKKVGGDIVAWGLVWQYGLICLLANLLIFSLIVFWGLLLTHRMNGPIPRLKQEFDEMYESEDPHLIYVRQNDYLGPFVEKLNKVLFFLMEEAGMVDQSEVVEET